MTDNSCAVDVKENINKYNFKSSAKSETKGTLSIVSFSHMVNRNKWTSMNAFKKENEKKTGKNNRNSHICKSIDCPCALPVSYDV